MQDLINKLSVGRTPKTVRNYTGFIHDVLDSKGIALGKIRLPQKVRPTLHIPTDDAIRKVLESAKNTVLYIPILLAAFCTMRRGEICALNLSDICGNVIHVSRSIVKGSDKKLYPKAPKTLSSDRYIDAPSFIIQAIKERGYITKLSPFWCILFRMYKIP